MQIIDFLKLAPNQLLASRAVNLSERRFFQNLSRSGNIFWGETPTADGSRWSVVFSLEKLAFGCSCPFLPKPCFHALALAQLAANEPLAFAETEIFPEWASALLAGETVVSRRMTSLETKVVEKQKRRFERLERTAAGFDDLENWLLDTARRGLASTVGEDPKFYENIAARLADASMTGISRQLRLLGQIRVSEPDWADRMLAVLADLHLAVRSFRQRETLPEALMHDLQNFIGIATKKEEVLSAGELVADTWAVLAQQEEMIENGLAGRRTWLFGAKSGRTAAIQDYAFLSAAGFPPGFRTGDIFRGEVVFYSSAWPIRVLLKDGATMLPRKVEKMPGFTDFQSFINLFSSSVGHQPWLTGAGQPGFPAAFEAVEVVFFEKNFLLKDSVGHAIQLAVNEPIGWKMLAISGGKPIGVFGEWGGARLKPMSTTADGRLVSLTEFRATRIEHDSLLLPSF